MSETGSEYTKPLPTLEGLSGEFYGWCKKEELRFQRCSGCGVWRHVPREICAACSSWEWEWVRSSGRGSVFTWTVIGRALHPAFQDDVALAPTVVELEEGVRLLSRIVDCPPEELEIGMPVEVVFDAVTDEVTLPMFRRVQA
ncbi:MAG: OB-fold domain-containing protein [Deltaproteobacteria bacterium]|nr:OB-fold domain-containing protein [Deltaproteobacteria bacterium]MBW2418372.1 OB-fold domain-containing protein [Deltaproteobacteria bacterium]